LRIVLSGDALFVCGAVLQSAQDNRWSYVLTFKEGRLPSVWAATSVSANGERLAWDTGSGLSTPRSSIRSGSSR